MSEKHRWTYEEDFTCCLEYLNFVFENEGDDSTERLVDIIADKLPNIKRGSIRMKLQNIKEVALDAGLEDRLEISPLYQYSAQCKRAFNSAVNYLEQQKKNYTAWVHTLKPVIAKNELCDEDKRKLIGAEVEHKLFGIGKVIDINSKYIDIEFANKTAKFLFDTMLKNFITFKDERIQAIAFGAMKENGRIYKKRARSTGLKYDPIEDTPEFLKIEDELEALIEAKIGKNRFLGFCFFYWSAKKEILKEKYGIDWKSPSELNPHVMFD